MSCGPHITVVCLLKQRDSWQSEQESQSGLTGLKQSVLKAKKKERKKEDVITVECFSDNKKHRLQKTSEWIEDWLRDKMSNSVLLEDDTARCEPGQEGRQWKRTAQ